MRTGRDGHHGRGPQDDRRHGRRGLARALLLTALGGLLPGTAFLAAGRRRLGLAVLTATLLLLGVGGVLLAGRDTADALRLAVDPAALGWVVAGVVVLVLAWVVVVAGGWRALRPDGLPARQRAVGAGLVVLLCAGAAVPAALVLRSVSAQRELIGTVFSDDRESATVVEPVDPVDPFGDDERVNVLLLGGDGGEGRVGVRTDTVIVASIATETGETTLFSLPRNLQDLPFPADSPLAEVWPDGFDAGSESASLLNKVYRNGPRIAGEVLGPTDDPGADMLKLGVGEALGLRIDYYVLVNMAGFTRLVDALGGITVDVNYYVPINGIVGEQLPDDHIEPGPDQHMDGWTALHFARGRYGMSDYDRMARQRCAIQALVDAADPVTLLVEWQELAATAGDIVRTDIPRSVLDDFLELALLVQDVDIDSVVLDPELIDPAYPDYDRIRAMVDEALAPAPPAPPVPPQAGGAPAPTVDVETGPAGDVEDACAYDPERAEAALAAGEPPTRGSG
ncbi:LCP family protein [Geodermatophilus marinus]|uniref:LCP family protein n=1 Tax=Geodermatophilus sp. LHW52908 TaxID=2303986 RepID=UPI001F455224|nr:LCP family protein [Geodermatophilus sp. LHW52908]